MKLPGGLKHDIMSFPDYEACSCQALPLNLDEGQALLMFVC